MKIAEIELNEQETEAILYIDQNTDYTKDTPAKEILYTLDIETDINTKLVNSTNVRIALMVIEKELG
tara:strand:+ start:834 stop:1034 length:201 start_codon:yes stop_codon:yes gene_type:complete